MPNSVESANLILKLYELRREETMRKARDFMFSFDPKSFEEMTAGFMGPQSGYIRMVISYWEMAATLVTNGAIDAKMFDESNGEHIGVFAKMEPFIPQFREQFKNPNFLKNLEQLCLGAPDGRKRVDTVREFMRGIMATMRAQAATTRP